MPRKTREQKVIADLRRQLRLRDGVLKEAAPRQPVIADAPTVSLPDQKPAPREVKEPVGSIHLKRDLIRVGSLVAVAVILEFIVSLAITSGALKPLGLS